MRFAKRKNDSHSSKEGVSFDAWATERPVFAVQPRCLGGDELANGRGSAVLGSSGQTFLGGIMATADLFPIEVWCCFSLSPLMDRRRACIRAMKVSKLANFATSCLK